MFPGFTLQRLVFTSDRVGSRKRPYDLSKIGVVSGVISSMESESRKNQNVSISFDFVYDSVAYDPVKTRLSEAGAGEQANRKAWNRT